MARFREVLRRRNFFLLWLGQIVSQLGDRLGQMALIAFVSLRPDGSGSTIEIAKILSFTIIPVFVVGPIAGVYVDRWDRRRTMYASDSLRAILMFVIAFFLFYAKTLIPVYLIIFLVFCIGRFFVPAKLSIIPDLVEKKDLLMANSLVNITGMIATILGFGLGGLLVERMGAQGAFYLDAFSFLFSGTLIFFIATKTRGSGGLKKVGQEIVEVIKKSILQEIKEGVSYFLKSKEMRFTAIAMFALSSVLGAVSVVLISFTQDVFGTVTRHVGLLSMYLGVGLFIGSVLYGKFGHRLSQYKIILISLVVSGMLLIAFVLALRQKPVFLAAAIFSFLIGIFLSPVIIATNTIVHKASDNDMMGKMFSSLEIVMHLGFLLFMFVSGMLARSIPKAYILIVAGGMIIAIGTLNSIFYRKFKWLD